MRLDISQTGAATVRRLASRSPMQLLTNLIEGDPTSDRDRLFQEWLQQMLEADGLSHLTIDQESYLWAALRHTFANLLSSLDRDGRKQKKKPFLFPTEERTATQQATIELVKQQIERTVLLDYILSNGKKLRDCTGAECIKEGGWLAAIGKKVGRRIVGQVLSEKQVAELRKI